MDRKKEILLEGTEHVYAHPSEYEYAANAWLHEADFNVAHFHYSDFQSDYGDESGNEGGDLDGDGGGDGGGEEVLEDGGGDDSDDDLEMGDNFFTLQDVMNINKMNETFYRNKFSRFLIASSYYRLKSYQFDMERRRLLQCLIDHGLFQLGSDTGDANDAVAKALAELEGHPQVLQRNQVFDLL